MDRPLFYKLVGEFVPFREKFFRAIDNIHKNPSVYNHKLAQLRERSLAKTNIVRVSAPAFSFKNNFNNKFNRPTLLVDEKGPKIVPFDRHVAPYVKSIFGLASLYRILRSKNIPIPSYGSVSDLQKFSKFLKSANLTRLFNYSNYPFDKTL
jgi:hypothetical protein